MKKIMTILTILMCVASTNVFAQLKEVRGVQTRVVTYQSDEKIDGSPKIDYYRHGFEFKNENNYAVWVEAELSTNGYDNGLSKYSDSYKSINAGIYDTKSFTLQAGETYVWKCGDRMIKKINGYYARDYYDLYYVTYKAYKQE
ncbi:MAG: hypothetical protein KBT67_06275 [bacterium]|nr:hypothetical protein [Candidatus Limimorpha caballi]